MPDRTRRAVLRRMALLPALDLSDWLDGLFGDETSTQRIDDLAAKVDDLAERVETVERNLPEPGAHLVNNDGTWTVTGLRKLPADYETVNISFDEPRTPNQDRTTRVYAMVGVESAGGTMGEVLGQVDPGTGYFNVGVWSADVDVGDLASTNEVRVEHVESWEVNPGDSYRIKNVSDPAGTNTLEFVRETTL